MKAFSTIMLLIIFSSFLFENSSAQVNTIKSQQKAKKLADWKKKQPAQKKRRMQLSEDSDLDLVYKRCDQGHTPDSLDDCTKYKTENSSCCMFTYGVDSGCVLIGFQYLGSKTVGDMTINCIGSFIKDMKIMLIVLSLLLL